ncbi:hypothetical protein niasHT_031364 [Heterodera trifolii]|uniref:Uncharacterized protein n=1 Tax=Heterodera trifolii TaxID=157864 RepID=A0ABD2J695_9BILA
MSDRRKEAEEKMAKAIFISADCWLCVFDLLSPRQLGFGIAMISHRFDFYVDEHFKTRKWTFGRIRIWRKFGKNGTNEMEIFNYDGKPMPFPQVQLPRKVVAFKCIEILYIDQNAIALLRHFRPLFDSFCPINLAIHTTTDRITEFLLHNIWPIFGKNLHGMGLSARIFHRLRQFASSFLNDYPSLRVVNIYVVNIFPEFPADDSAAASDGQLVAKWLFTPRPDVVPKVFKCHLDMDDGNFASRIEGFIKAFSLASSPVNFIVVIWFYSSFDDSVLSFDLTNELTREHLALKRINNSHGFLLIRCPIARDESKWTKWEKEAIGRDFQQWNQIDFHIYNEDNIGNGLLDASPGPSDH